MLRNARYTEGQHSHDILDKEGYCSGLQHSLHADDAVAPTGKPSVSRV
jgi:hypothetical protein